MTRSRNILSRHGMSKHAPEYRSWYAMRRRCNNPNNQDFQHYGGRGIKVCPEWNGSNDFLVFLADMGRKPTLSHSLDRIDVNGDYTSDNCRWVTQDIQVKNTRKRKDNKSGIPGVRKRNQGDFIAVIDANKSRQYLGLFETFFDACCARKSAENKYWRIA